MRRRSPTILMVSTLVFATRAAPPAAVPPAPRRKALRSSWEMRPAGPLPLTWRRSTPASRARRRTAGEAIGLAIAGRGKEGGTASARTTGFGGAVGRGAFSATAGSAFFGSRGGSAAAAGLGVATTSSLPAPATSRRTSAAPTASTLPTSPPRATTVPATGDGISTVALSVMTAARTWSSSTDWPISTCHSTISASATPSPTSGSLTMRMPISSLHHGLEGTADTRRPGEVIPFLSVRIGRVPAGHAHDWRLEAVEATLLHERRQLGAVAAGQRRLVDDDAPPGFLDRRDDRLDVVGQQGAQVDHLGVDPGLGGGGLGHEDHGAI